MELRIPTLEQLQTVYNSDMKSAFPAAELKPLSAIQRMWREQRYKPYCLFDGDDIVGECFLCLGHPGWALLDYLCVSSRARNAGLGALILAKLREVEPGTVVFGEAEASEHAPDPALSEGRLGFYARNGLQTAGYDTEVFGVHYKTLYLADHKVEDAALMAEHDFVYKNSFTPEKYAKYVRIPYDPAKVPGEQVAWDQ